MNVLTSLQKQYYSKKVQSELFFKVTALSLAKMIDMPHGTTYNNPRIDFNSVQSYTKNTDVTIQAANTSNETLTIDQTPIVPFGIDEVELLEIDYNLIDDLAMKAAQVIKEDLDGNFFNEILNAGYGNATAITLTTSNTVNTFTQAVAELTNEGVDVTKLVSTIDPYAKAIIGESALGNTFKEADLAFRRGFRGQFAETMVNVSTLLTATGDLALATLPTAADTVTINGVVFKFVAAIGTAGDVLIAVDAAGSLANLVAAINGAAGAGTTYTEVSAKDRNRKLAGITATDNATSINITSKRGYRKLSSALTAAADKFGVIVIYNAIMEKGAISLSVQKGINLVIKDRPLQLGKNFFTWMRYGIKTFSEGASRMYALKLVAQAAE